MSFLARFKHPVSSLKSIPHHLPTGLEHGHGFKPFLYDKVERTAMGAALGAVKGYYYDRAVFKGIGIEAWIAALGYLGSAFLGGSDHLERAGDTGLTAYAYSIGASWGADRANRGISSTRSLPGGKKQVVGTIPPRASGAFLTADEMAHYSAPR